jgi:hypothetical protein
VKVRTVKKIRAKPLTDKDRRLVADFMEYMRAGGEIGEVIKRQAIAHKAVGGSSRR